jgi:RNA polymerase sigma factor (sigma-70 family)
MPTPGLSSAVQELARALAPADAELLARFAEHRDDDAFAVIVGRHGRLVFDVCRCVLRHHADAEDAFQATFLILARKAGSVRKAASLASWLHAVAYRTARKALAAAARRRGHEAKAIVREPVEQYDRDWGEVQQVLHEELLALPERLRAVLVLCYLEGMAQDRVAAVLGLTKAAVKKRLERGREQLRQRLARRGVAPAAVLAAFASPAAVAGLPPALATSTAAAALAFVSVPVAPGAIPAPVLSLVHAEVNRMFLTKLSVVLSALLLAGFGAVALAWQSPAPPDPLPRPVAHGQTPGKAAPAEPRQPLLFLTGARSAVTDKELLRVTDPDEWKKVSQRHQGLIIGGWGGIEQPTVEIDFKRCELIAIFRGVRTNCRGLWLDSITETEDQLTIRFTDATYQTVGKGATATPYGFLLIPVTKKTVVIERNTQNLIGQPPIWTEQARLKPQE